MKTQRLASAFTRVIVTSFVVILCAAVPASAQVLFDAASNSTPATTSAAASFTVAWNHTVGLAKNPYWWSASRSILSRRRLVGGVIYGNEAGGRHRT